MQQKRILQRSDIAAARAPLFASTSSSGIGPQNEHRPRRSLNGLRTLFIYLYNTIFGPVLNPVRSDSQKIIKSSQTIIQSSQVADFNTQNHSIQPRHCYSVAVWLNLMISIFHQTVCPIFQSCLPPVASRCRMENQFRVRPTAAPKKNYFLTTTIKKLLNLY